MPESSAATAGHARTKSDFDRPILITGCARSRTSMVAGVISKCGVWGGEMFGAAAGNETGFFENKHLRERLVKPWLKMMDVDPLGVSPLPPYPDAEHWGPQVREAVEKFLEDQGYEGERWFYKGAKMAYLWPAWAEAFPDAKWVIVRRDKEEIIDSCLRTHFMAQHSQDREFWSQWVDATEMRLEDLKQAVDYIEVWPPDGLREMVSELGLEWTDEAEEFVSNPKKQSEYLVDMKTANPIPDDDIISNIRRNIKRNVKRVQLSNVKREEPLVIVGGAPSLKETVHDLKHQEGKILAINGVHDYLIDHGIKPWGMMMLDPREDMGKFASKPRKDVKYFIASQCDPQVFDRLRNYKVYLWHAWVGAGEKKFLETTDEKWLLIGGGSTCGLRAFHLGMVLGFQEIHCYGMDSCLHENDEELEHHAYEQDIRKSGLERVVTVHAAGTPFKATGWMYAQANDFNKLLTYHGDKFTVDFHGGGLLAHIAEKHPKRRSAYASQ